MPTSTGMYKKVNIARIQSQRSRLARPNVRNRSRSSNLCATRQAGRLARTRLRLMTMLPPPRRLTAGSIWRQLVSLVPIAVRTRHLLAAPERSDLPSWPWLQLHQSRLLRFFCDHWTSSGNPIDLRVISRATEITASPFYAR